MARKFDAIAARRAPIKPGIMGQAPDGQGVARGQAFALRPHAHGPGGQAKLAR